MKLREKKRVYEGTKDRKNDRKIISWMREKSTWKKNYKNERGK